MEEEEAADPRRRPAGLLCEGATRWLGVWLDSVFALVDNRRRRKNRARQAEARICRLDNKNGILPTSARNSQTSNIQSTMLCSAELAWWGKKTKQIENEHPPGH